MDIDDKLEADLAKPCVLGFPKQVLLVKFIIGSFAWADFPYPSHLQTFATRSRRTLDQICTLKIWMRPTMIRYAATK